MFRSRVWLQPASLAQRARSLSHTAHSLWRPVAKALPACTQDYLPPCEWHSAMLPSMSARVPWSVHRPPSPSYKLGKDEDRFIYS